MYLQLAAGLCCGLSCLAAGGTIGILGDVGTKAFGMKASRGKRWWDGIEEEQDEMAQDAAQAEEANKLFVGLLIMLIFAEALALYGLIVALILSQRTYYCDSNN